jgi:hypothetical protein
MNIRAVARICAVPAATVALSLLSPGVALAQVTPDAPNGACTNFYAAGAQLVEGAVNVPWANTAKPQRGDTVREANYNTCQVRVTDHTADGLATFARNDYSRRQPFNSDSTRQIVYALDGHWHLYDARTYQHLKVLPGLAADAEPQWHAKKADMLFYLPTNGVGMKVYRLNVETGESVVVGDLASRLKARWPSANAAWTKSEGSPSADGRYWCFMVDSSSWGGLGLVTWDRFTDTILGYKDLNGQRPDHVSMSPTGNYCVSSSYGGPGVVAYSRDFTSSRKIANIGEHSDIGLDANGDDAYISVDYQARAGEVFMVNLRTGVRTNILPSYLNGTATAFHFSGKGYRKPGWFVMSSYAENGGSKQWLHRKVAVVQMTASPKIYNLADTRVYASGYWAEPQAAANRDLTKVVWTSNWDVHNETNLDVYMVQIPADSIQ